MLTPITNERLLKAIHRMSFTDEWKLYEEYLIQELARLDADNRVATGQNLAWQQGAAQVLSEQIMQAQSVMETIHNLSLRAGRRPAA